jgi:hypothetical protein
MEATATRASAAWQALPPVRTPAEQIAALTSAAEQAPSWKPAPISTKEVTSTGTACLRERALPGVMAAAVELRRRFPGITSHAHAGEGALTVTESPGLPVTPTR